MTDQVENQETEVTQDELTTLKQRADQMGLSYHPSIGVAKLRDKINDALAGDKGEGSEEGQTEGAEEATEGESLKARRKRKREDALQLARIRVTCMNPQKKEWEGEIFTVSNNLVGTQKKFVPFNADDGWHVPRIILNQLKNRECQVFHTVKDERGNKMRQGKLIKEFAIEELPPLTEKELQDLAQRQAMARGQ